MFKEWSSASFDQTVTVIIFKNTVYTPKNELEKSKNHNFSFSHSWATGNSLFFL